jgi:hypothetical protein
VKRRIFNNAGTMVAYLVSGTHFTDNIGNQITFDELNGLLGDDEPANALRHDQIDDIVSGLTNDDDNPNHSLNRDGVWSVANDINKVYDAECAKDIFVDSLFRHFADEAEIMSAFGSEDETEEDEEDETEEEEN